jgi:TonB-dependent receptor
MHNTQQDLRSHKVLVAAASAFLIGANALAQESEVQQANQGEEMEEVIAVYRLLSAAESLTNERINLPFSADFLGAEVMSRTGDPDIGQALRRVPGLTLIDGKFVYIRGLGERYSQVLVNGASVPSPDLTRSVVPLDLFPTSIVDSVKIQKSPSPDQPAAFGGGSIDIRTTALPNDVVATFQIGSGFNDMSDGEGLSYASGGSTLPQAIRDAIPAYGGNIEVENIRRTLQSQNTLLTTAQARTQARTIHQGLIDSLDTNVNPTTQSLDPDLNFRIALGNSWDVGDNWRFGVLANATYNERWRNEDSRREAIGAPDIQFFDIENTVYEERSVNALNLGAEFAGLHTLTWSYYSLENDEDQANIARGFDQNNELVDLDQAVRYSTRLEERELEITQIRGEHAFFDSPILTGLFEAAPGLENLEIDWFYSDSTAKTDIPNETLFQASTLLDANLNPIQTQLSGQGAMGRFSFLDLDDEQTSWGTNLRLPYDVGNNRITISGGWWNSKKSREYYGYNIALNATGVQSSFLQGTPGDVFSSGNVTLENGFDLSLDGGIGTESYLAAQKVNTGYLTFDIEIGTDWRITAGARAEDFQQAVLPIDLLDFSGASIINLQNQLADPTSRLAVNENDVFSSFAITRSGSGLFGSDQHQFRLSYGETIVRPDLREVAGTANFPVFFLDPELDIRIAGNPFVTSSPLENLELRGEFFYGNGDNFTVTLFHKDIESPIERIRAVGTDDNVVLTFDNADSGEVYGVEFEGTKQLWQGLFLAGNVTLSDSEIDFQNALFDVTNDTRRLTGHSEYVANATLGYDSNNGQHSVFLNYNVYGERIFAAGIEGIDDAFEQPFNSLGVVYKYFPTDNLQIQASLDNILDEEFEIQQMNADGDLARIIVQEVGKSFGLSVRWSF